MFSVGGFFGSMVYGYICDKIGRQWALRTVAVPQILSFLLVAFATNAGMIMASRLLIGFSAGGLYVSIPLFVSEISQDM
jgi:MFS family permease